MYYHSTIKFLPDLFAPIDRYQNPATHKLILKALETEFTCICSVCLTEPERNEFGDTVILLLNTTKEQYTLLYSSLNRQHGNSTEHAHMVQYINNVLAI